VKAKEETLEERLEYGLGMIAGPWPPVSEKSTILFIHRVGRLENDMGRARSAVPSFNTCSST